MKKMVSLVIAVLLVMSLTVTALAASANGTASSYGGKYSTAQDKKDYTTTTAYLSVKANRNISATLAMAMRLYHSDGSQASSSKDFVPTTSTKTFTRTYNSSYSGSAGKGSKFYARIQTNSKDQAAATLTGSFNADY